ncbi:MAG TPA: LysR family transcriptional regulator [Terriglobales bacterium]|nr:LysR family transcriptional regulator [Terriglobales bacterium]
MDLQAIEYFVAVAEHRSFTRAAAACYVTQPALSRRIKELEREVGCPLLRRTTRSVELTEAGLAFLAHALRIVRSCGELRRDMRRFSKGIAGALRVGFVTLGHVDYITRAIARLDAEGSGLEMTVVRGNPPELKEALREGRLDCALLHAPSLADAGWADSVRVARATIVARVVADSPLNDGEPVTLARIAAQPMVRYPRAMAPLCYDLVDEAFAAAGLAPTVGVQAVDQEGITIHTTAGHGVSLVGSINPPWEGVVSLPIANWHPDFNLHLVQRRHDANPLLAVLRGVMLDMSEAGDL